MEKFKCLCDLKEFIFNVNCDGDNIHLFADYDVVCELLKAFIGEYNYGFDSISIGDLENDCGDYLIQLFFDGTLNVSPALDAVNDYITVCNCENCFTLVHQECNSGIAIANPHAEVFCFDCEDEVETEIEIDIDEEQDGHVISQTLTNEDGSVYHRSFYSTDINLVKEMLDAWK